MIPQDLNLDDFEIVYPPVPENETPRQFMQRMTGHDFDALDAFTWELIRKDIPMQKFLSGMIARLGKPQIILKQKGE